MECVHRMPMRMCIQCRVDASDEHAKRKHIEEQMGLCTNPACQHVRQHTEGLTNQFNKLVLAMECIVARNSGRMTIVLKDESRYVAGRGLVVREAIEKRGPVLRLTLEEPKDVQQTESDGEVGTGEQ